MGFNIILGLFSENLGMTFETILFIIYLIMGIIWFAVDYKIGVVMLLLVALGFFTWLYVVDMFYGRFLTMVIISIILLALNLYSLAQVKYGGSII